MRPYNERRNKKVVVLFERRKPQKEIARIVGISYANVRWILYRYRNLTKTNKIDIDSSRKVA